APRPAARASPVTRFTSSAIRDSPTLTDATVSGRAATAGMLIAVEGVTAGAGAASISLATVCAPAARPTL
ncbi:MAG: hypothetical protein ABI838_09325, partial [Chloroflexota bacterium]